MCIHRHAAVACENCAVEAWRKGRREKRRETRSSREKSEERGRRSAASAGRAPGPAAKGSLFGSTQAPSSTHRRCPTQALPPAALQRERGKHGKSKHKKAGSTSLPPSPHPRSLRSPSGCLDRPGHSRRLAVSGSLRRAFPHSPRLRVSRARRGRGFTRARRPRGSSAFMARALTGRVSRRDAS